MSAGGGASISSVQSDINVTPMADIMLVLLIIFMITTPLLQEGILVNKAKAANAQEEPLVDAENATMVTITRDQLVYINSEAVAESDLIESFSDRIAAAPDLPLFIKGDVATPYAKVVLVINQAREAGYERIGLLVDREREGVQ
ncbi:MAG: ExbD/TolR family protein [Acidobacteriota bacterium]